MHPCPCCGYKTLPHRGEYDLCPVCWWEDEGLEPWEFSGPNGKTLVEAQQEYLEQRLPYRLRQGKVRAPKRGEERDPDWLPFELTDELVGRVERANLQEQRWLEEERRRAEEESELDPEGPFKEYNARLRDLKAEAIHLPHSEVKTRLRDLSHAQGLMFPDAEIELLSRLIKDETFYRRHPLRAVGWLLRYSRPKTFRRRWKELRTGGVRVAG
ncbi:MAG: CPCC family cysteine-rich protein [Nocardioides sp.]